MQLKNKIQMVQLVPLAIVIIMVIQLIYLKTNDYRMANHMTSNLELMANTVDLITNLQKERGMSNMFVSGNEQAKTTLITIREEVDKYLQVFKNSVSNAKIEKNKITQFLNSLEELSTLRNSVDGKGEASNILSQYTSIIQDLMKIDRALLQDKTSFGMGKQMGNLVTLLESQENLALLRGTESGILANNKTINTELLAKISLLYGGFRANLSSATLILSPDNEERRQQINRSDDLNRFNNFHTTIIAKSQIGNYEIDPQMFFKVATNIISEISNIITVEKVAIIDKISKIKEDSYRSIIYTLILFVVVIVISIASSTFLSNSITKSVYKMIEQLSVLSERLAGSSSTLSNSSNKLAEAVQSQASAVEETSASVEEMNGILQQSVENAKRSYSLSEDVKKIVEESNTSMGELIDSMQDILSSNNNIQKLAELMETIADKTTIIDEIVFQTKLLSFNASVEAERAGEHGRGFAVVAQEVGNLAQLSGKSANEISSIVKGGVVAAETTTKENKEKVENGNVRVKLVADHLKTIIEKSEASSQSAHQIAQSAKEQATGINQINVAITELDKANQSNAEIADRVASTSTELLNNAQEMNNYIKDIRKLITGV